MSKKHVYFTQKGDDGTTNIYGQKERIAKYHPRPAAYGAIDEAQAVLAVLRAQNAQPRTKEIILRVERDLYLIMSQLAVAESIKLSARPIGPEDVTWLEETCLEIGAFTGGFSDFVLPGDSLTGAQAHIARTVVRRAERETARLHHENALSNPAILPYLNRLSSLLFLLALYEDVQNGVTKPTYAKHIKD